MNLDSETLKSEYEEKIRSWDWYTISTWFDVHKDYEDYYDQDGDDRYVFQWIGTVFGLTPSGKVYALWTTNQTDEDVLRDTAWWEALEDVAAENGCFVSSPEFGDSDGIYLCRRYDVPEEEENEDEND